MKIIVYNVKYSENLGDGLLAMCLEWGIQQADSTIDVETIDLAGRTVFGGHSSNRKQLLKILQFLPPLLRQNLVRWRLKRQLAKYADEWGRKISSADAVVLGGGNLLQDDDLNFPTKVSTLLEYVQRYDRPMAVYAVGVGHIWSPKARKLFEALQSVNLVYCSVRDKLAHEAFVGHFPKLNPPKIAQDPALCASSMWQPSSTKIKSRRKCIGICVTDPLILSRHANIKINKIPVLADLEFRGLIDTLISRGYDILLFCNGAREDMKEIYKHSSNQLISKHIKSNRVRISLRPEHPISLLETIGSTDAVIAHRLHACIAAYALGIPNVGMAWDNKVKGFFLNTDRAQFFADEGSTADFIADLACSAIELGIDPASRGKKLEQAYSEIENLVCVLKNRRLKCNETSLDSAS